MVNSNSKKPKKIDEWSLINYIYIQQQQEAKQKKLASPGFEPETFSVLDWRDNQLHHETFGPTLDCMIGKGYEKKKLRNWDHITSQSYGIENKGKLHEMPFGKGSGETQEMAAAPSF